MIKARVIFSLVFLGFFLTTAVRANQNITGIWEGVYDSGKHLFPLKSEITKLDAVTSSEENGMSILRKLFTASSGQALSSTQVVTYPFKTKMYYKDGQIHLIDLSGTRTNMLHFVGLPDLFSNLPGANTLPELTELIVPLEGGQESIEIRKKSSGTFNVEGPHKYEIELTSSFKYQNNKYLSNILIFHIDGSITIESLDKKPHNTREDVTFSVEMPLQRNIDHSSWTPEEIEALLIGLADHPYYDINWGKKDEAAHRRLPEVIWGGSEEGYKHLMEFAFEKYGMKKPIKAIFYPKLEFPAQYDRIANIAPGEYFVKIGPKAFLHPTLYLVSTYVHEYTHYKQNWATWTKSQRETEAYCVQMEWLKDNYSNNPTLNYLPLATLLAEAEGGYTADPQIQGTPLTCDNTLGLKRWNEINIELQGRVSGTSAQMSVPNDNFNPSQESGEGKEWNTILND